MMSPGQMMSSDASDELQHKMRNLFLGARLVRRPGALARECSCLVSSGEEC